MENIASKLIHGSMLRLTVLIAMVVASFILTPFIIRNLGDKMFGLWSLVGSLMGVSGFLDFGLSMALKRYFPKYYAANSTQKVSEVFCSSFFVFSIIGVATIISVFVFIQPIYGVFGDDVGLRIFNIIFVIMGIDVAIQLPVRTLVGYFESHLKYGLLSRIDLVKIILRSGLIYYFLLHGHGIIAMAAIALLVNLLGHILLIVAYFVKDRDIRISWNNVSGSTLKLLFSHSYKNVISSIGDLLRFQIDNFLIAAYLDLSRVGVYAIGSRIAQYFIDVIGAFIGQTVPIFSDIESRGESESLREVYYLLTKISTMLSVYVGGMLIIMGKQFILRWVGIGFENSYTVLIILTAGLTISLSQYPIYNLLRGISKHFIVMVCNVGEGIVNIILSIILIKYYGIVGVAFGTMIPMIASSIIAIPYLTSKHVDYLQLSEFYFKEVGPMFIKCVCAMICIHLLASPFLIPEYFRLSLIGLCSLAYFPIIYVMGFSKHEKQYYLTPVDRIRSMFGQSSI